ncbi:putative transcription factor GARP-G2-like family [Helianthus debilis subsp. tardiflorus]
MLFNNSVVHMVVATPKQIRELMKVDRLTNDEVKSHLQGEYR